MSVRLVCVGIAMAAAPFLASEVEAQTDLRVGPRLVTPSEAEELLETAKSVELDTLGRLTCTSNVAVGLAWGFLQSVPGSKIDNVPVGGEVTVIQEGRQRSGRICFFGRKPTLYNCSTSAEKPHLLFTLLAQSESLSQTISLLRTQFSSLGDRLKILHENREKLAIKYQRYSLDFLKTIDGDIVQLSRMGMDLANVTIRFFEAAEPKLIELEQKNDVLKVRQKALAGLRDFSADIEQASQMAAAAGSDQSFVEITAQIDKAVRELERSIGQTGNVPE